MNLYSPYINEYMIPFVGLDLHGPINVCETDSHIFAVFYLPFMDPENMPVDEKYGGDSFGVYREGLGTTVFNIRNGVGHGYKGRNAINIGSQSLRDLFRGKILDQDLAEALSKETDLLWRPDLLMYGWNLNIFDLVQENVQDLASLAAVFGTIKGQVLRYVQCGDCRIFIVNEAGNIKTPSIREASAFSLGWFPFTYKSNPDAFPFHELTLDKEDKIILCTDGVADSVSLEPGADETLEDIISRGASLAPKELIQRINCEIKGIRQSKAPHQDDYTLMVICSK